MMVFDRFSKPPSVTMARTLVQSIVWSQSCSDTKGMLHTTQAWILFMKEYSYCSGSGWVDGLCLGNILHTFIHAYPRERNTSPTTGTFCNDRTGSWFSFEMDRVEGEQLSPHTSHISRFQSPWNIYLHHKRRSHRYTSGHFMKTWPGRSMQC